MPVIRNNTSQHGFTLIELLIAIAIIGILTSVVLVNLVGVQERGRDSRRKSDLQSVKTALELYRSDLGSYPPSPLPSCPTSGSIQAGTPPVVYMQKVPCDPLGTGIYVPTYRYDRPTTSTYTLKACMENTNDNDQNSVTGDAQCPGTKAFILRQP